MKNVLILGSTGMIGSQLTVEARNRGFEVTEATRSGGDGKIALDASNTETLTAALTGKDVLISAISPPRDGSEPSGPLVAVGRSLIAAARAAGVKRVLLVGGAGSLLLEDGTRLVDQPWFPAEVKPEALAHGDLLDLWRTEASDLDWSYLSPPTMIAPGERTGTFTLGVDRLVANAEGESSISVEDYAVALIDELEASAHIRQRFTLAYA